MLDLIEDKTILDNCANFLDKALKEAKTLYKTLKETTVGTKQKGPKSLSESVQRKQVLSAHLPRRKQENTTESHDFATRMKKLAGLD